MDLSNLNMNQQEKSKILSIIAFSPSILIGKRFAIQREEDVFWRVKRRNVC